MRNYFRSSLVLVLLALCLGAWSQVTGPNFHPRAVPLVSHDPYFSIWSFNDKLTDGPTRHWTGKPQHLTGYVRIDGAAYRWMGDDPKSLPALPQTGLEVWPTRTIYHFQRSGIGLDVTFLNPLLPQDLDILSRPVTYLNWQVRSTDGKQHQVQLYLDAGSDLAVDTDDESVTWSRAHLQGLDLMRTGTFRQPILQKFGDNVRIDWGWFYLGVPTAEGGDAPATVEDRAGHARSQFLKDGTLPASDALDMPRPIVSPASQTMPVLAVAFNLPSVGADAQSRHVLLAYDDIRSLEYMHRSLDAWWRRNGETMGGLLAQAEHDYPSLEQRSIALDQKLMADLRTVGGEGYADLGSLSFRQCLSAEKLVSDFNGQPMFFPKENFSNGDIGTVDVIYPGAPLLLMMNPQLLEAELTPLFDYAESPMWNAPYSPHDLGTYPLANGHPYGPEEQMPVEESGNMLLLVAGVAQAEGNPSFAARYWPLLTQWAEYLKAKGMDPGDQLSTDDFAGPLAHSANLSLKAILAMGAYARLAGMMGKPEVAASWRQMAQQMAQEWMHRSDDGDHYRLAFDKPGTWSQKYNLVWDRLLGLNLFPASVAQKEVNFYAKHLNAFGFPLDNRKTYTKLDWEVWSASLTGNRADFDRLMVPVLRFVNESPTRVPLTDWYWTLDGKQTGFQARSVVGAIFEPILQHPQMWKKWVAEAKPATK